MSDSFYRDNGIWVFIKTCTIFICRRTASSSATTVLCRVAPAQNLVFSADAGLYRVFQEK